MQSSIKLLLFNRFLAQNPDYKLDIDFELDRCEEFFADQSKFWGDKSKHERIAKTIVSIRELVDEYRSAVEEINQSSTQRLRQEEQVVIKRDYDRYNQESIDTELVIQRQQQVEPAFIDVIRTEIGHYSEWKYAGVELNPSNGLLTRSMLACDPFYVYNGNLTDTSSITKRFNETFVEKRLFFYDKYEDLPQNSMGLATCINLYEFLPIDPIKDHLRNVYNLLMPGGHFIFTYNDCEQESGLDMLAGQESYRCYNTKTLMESLAYGTGFDIEASKDYKGVHSWMIVKKPGTLSSQKLSAPLVKADD